MRTFRGEGEDSWVVQRWHCTLWSKQMCVKSEAKGTRNRTWWGHQTMGKAEEEKHTKEIEQVWPGVENYLESGDMEVKGIYILKVFSREEQSTTSNPMKRTRKIMNGNVYS